VMDILAHFRALVREVDSSLIEEWEALSRPDGGRPRAQVARREPVDPAAERRAVIAGVRAELHRLVRALALRDNAGAARLIATGEGAAWTPERIEQAMAPYFAEHAAISTTPDARRPNRTRIDELGEGRLRVQQVLVDPEGDEDWSIDAIVDLSLERPEGAPRLDVQRIGV
jgi:uncharacterized protein DUF3516